MICNRMPIIALLVFTGLFFATNRADSQSRDNQKDDPLRNQLLSAGYVAIPLIEEESNHYIVECKLGDETCRMLLDSGTSVSTLDIRLVKKLALEPEGEFKATSLTGTSEGVFVLVRGYSLGAFDTRALTDKVSTGAVDLSEMNDHIKARNRLPIDGIIGQSMLKFTNAVIDYSSNTLYMITPLNKLWPQIEGKWVAVTGEANGRPIEIDPKNAPELEFKDRKFYYVDGDIKLKYGMHLDPTDNHFRFVFFDPKKEFDEELNYENVGLLKLSDGRITLCFHPNPKLAKAVPKGFQTEEDSGLILLEFERKK